MDDMISLISRWMHILPAVVMVGGAIFTQLVLCPSLDGNDPENAVKQQIKRKWSKVIMGCALLLLLSGLYNTMVIFGADDKPGGMYHGLLALKLVLACSIFYISSMLAGKSDAALKFQEKEAFWGKINMYAAIIVVLLAGGMRVVPRAAAEETAMVVSLVDSQDETIISTK
ncbi:MAG: hypothetical protein HOB73_11690 [Planctomycetaceae bacterium]|jgi:hypothetical protein|nr:hypothetical protein [Planctomycetaceae bacterium]